MENKDTKPEQPQYAGAARLTDEEQGDSRRSSMSSLPATFQKILRYGRVEARGIEPIPLEERKSTRYYNIATIWTSINTNIIGITFGMLGPLAYRLSLRDSALVILFFNIISCIIPGYLSTLGPKTGLRQMIQARYSFGRYLVSVPVLLNLATMTGFTVIIFITGGQCLTAVSNGTISPNAGIIIIGIISLVVSFCGFRILHIYETYAFVVAFIAITITAGCGGAGLAKQSIPLQQATAANVLSFGMIVASYQIPYAGLASDMSAYFNPKVSTWRVFWYTYFGLMTPTILLMTLGAAIAGAIPNNPVWQEQYDKYLVGGALSGMLAPAGGFGKFVLVILALTLLGNTCGTFYSITLNFQTLLPWLFRVPRYVFSLVITVIIVLVSIFAVDNFFESIENVVALIGYWSSQFCAIVIVEDVVFRRRDPATYEHAAWCDAKRLPLGIAAMSAGALAWGLIVPAMNQVYFTGPIAKHTGDLGFELAFFCSGLLYIPLRYAEKRLSGSRRRRLPHRRPREPPLITAASSSSSSTNATGRHRDGGLLTGTEYPFGVLVGELSVPAGMLGVFTGPPAGTSGEDEAPHRHQDPEHPDHRRDEADGCLGIPDLLGAAAAADITLCICRISRS